MIRYEDLKLNPKPVLKEMFCFLLDVQSIEGTVIEKRIDEATSEGFTGQQVYALKSTTMNLSRN